MNTPSIEEVIRIVREAAALFDRTGGFEVKDKGARENIVTSSDLAVQHFLTERLGELLPGSGFLCEEEDFKDLSHDSVWVIDPIDGTANYARGNENCCISVALVQDGAATLGVVYSPWRGELYSAVKGEGAFCNDKPIHVSDRPFEQGLLFTAMSTYRKELARRCSDIIYDIYMRCNDVRRTGSAAVELCLMAAGYADLYFEIRLMPWDYAAASLILTEAGGTVCDGFGKSPSLFEPSTVIAANTPESAERIEDCFKTQRAEEYMKECVKERKIMDLEEKNREMEGTIEQLKEDNRKLGRRIAFLGKENIELREAIEHANVRSNDPDTTPPKKESPRLPACAPIAGGLINAAGGGFAAGAIIGGIAGSTAGLVDDNPLPSDSGDADYEVLASENDNASPYSFAPARQEASHGSFLKRIFSKPAQTVYSALYAPGDVEQQEWFKVQVHLYTADESDKVEKKAKALDPDTRIMEYNPLSLQLRKGTSVDVELSVDDSNVEVKTPSRTIVWNGELTSAVFSVRTLAGFKGHSITGEVTLSVGGIPVGMLTFISRIGSGKSASGFAEVLSNPFRKAFISYSHKDVQTAEVMASVLRAQKLPYFFDHHSLESGEVFDEEIIKRIDDCDLFLLVWSQNAAESDYVRKEYTHAMTLSYPQIPKDAATITIKPLSIEPLAEPPAELRKLNFKRIHEDSAAF